MTGKGSKFTAKYNVKHLVYFECYEDCYDAICREKEIKGWTRRKKLALIQSVNPGIYFIDWHDGLIPDERRLS